MGRCNVVVLRGAIFEMLQLPGSVVLSVAGGVNQPVVSCYFAEALGTAHFVISIRELLAVGAGLLHQSFFDPFRNRLRITTMSEYRLRNYLHTNGSLRRLLSFP